MLRQETVLAFVTLRQPRLCDECGVHTMIRSRDASGDVE